tara:strand:+ start:142 stop:693 length:552 start_codon:yes stop_codon:yes gene_type:complete
VVELSFLSATGSELPIKIGNVSATEVNASLHLVAPFHGKSTQAAKVVNNEMGLDWPGIHELKRKGKSYAFWFDHNHIAFMGKAPLAKLARVAAVTDVSDGWCIVDVCGNDVRDVLARLTPLDIRKKYFKTGMTQRSMIMHAQASISCVEKSQFRLMVFRSMAQTLLHDLTTAMKSVAARTQKV